VKLDSTGRDDLVVTAAWLYYDAGLAQRQIAERLGVSRPTVVRMLQTARDVGLVEIRLTQPLPEATAAALDLEARLADTEVRRVVVATGEGKQSAASAAGRYLVKRIANDQVLGVGWSTTLALIDGISTVEEPPRWVVQLVGSVGPASRADAYEIALRLARMWGVSAATLPAPVFATDARMADSLRKDPVVAETYGWFDKCTIALVGIGTVSPESTMVDAGYLTVEDLEGVDAAGGVGDVLGWYFDKDGNPVPTSWSDRLIGATLDQLSAVENVVAVASGPSKIQAVVGAIRSVIINTLVIDRALARDLDGAL